MIYTNVDDWDAMNTQRMKQQLVDLMIELTYETNKVLNLTKEADIEKQVYNLRNFLHQFKEVNNDINA